MKYAIIGTGAIGGYYGGLLAKAGSDVHFLLHSDYDYVKANGLQVDSCDGDYRLDHPHIYRQTADMPVCDVIIVALKTTANDLLPQLLAPIMHEGSLILLIQNGIGVEADLQRAMPQAQIAGGVAYICTLKPEPGHITHLSNGRLLVGNYSCRDSDLIGRMMDDFAAAGIKAREMEYHEMRWKKAVWNMPFNGMTVAVGAPSAGSLIANSQMSRIIRRMMSEVIRAAQACGARNVDESYAEQMMEMTRKMPRFASSMKFDFDHHHPLELHYLYRRPIEEARAHGCEMPLISMLAAELAFLEEQRGLSATGSK